MRKTPRSGQNYDVVPLAREFIDQLDTGLRRYDAAVANGLAGFNVHIEIAQQVLAWLLRW